MTCRHQPGDPACGQGARDSAEAERERLEKELWTYKEAAKTPKTPDAENYSIEKIERVGKHLVLQVQYPNCKFCAYEGNKVMVFENVSEVEVLRWRKIDPHFADPTVQRPPREAPSPVARFPASEGGFWAAVQFAATIGRVTSR